MCTELWPFGRNEDKVQLTGKYSAISFIMF